MTLVFNPRIASEAYQLKSPIVAGKETNEIDLVRHDYLSPIRIFVHSPSDDIITFNQVRLNASVSELKSQLELRTGILAELQSLYFGNVRLEDEQTLGEKNLKNGSVLRVKIKDKSLQQIYIAASQGMFK